MVKKKSGANGDYLALAVAINGGSSLSGDNYTNFRTVLHIPLSGSGTDTDEGLAGYFWASTRSNDKEMYRLHFSNSYGWAQWDYGGREYAFSMRCILR